MKILHVMAVVRGVSALSVNARVPNVFETIGLHEIPEKRSREENWSVTCAMRFMNILDESQKPCFHCDRHGGGKALLVLLWPQTPHTSATFTRLIF